MESSQLVPLGDLRPSPTNPREGLGNLEELTESIRSVGVLQPLLVRTTTEGGRFEIVAGHRRFAAARKAQLERVPVIIRTLTDAQALELSVVENVQRENFSPLEEAGAFRRLHRDHGMPVETIASKVGRSRAHVYARLKLCDLAPGPRAAMAAGSLAPSAALLIARVEDPAEQERIAKEVIGRTVREASEAIDGELATKPRAPSNRLDAQARREAARRCIADMVAGARRRKPTAELWRVLGQLAFERATKASRKTIAIRRELREVGEILELVDGATERELHGLVLELLLGEAPYLATHSAGVRQALDLYRLDWSGTLREARRDLKAEGEK